MATFKDYKPRLDEMEMEKRLEQGAWGIMVIVAVALVGLFFQI